jgi:hypothetical protein
MICLPFVAYLQEVTIRIMDKCAIARRGGGGGKLEWR